MATTSIDGVTNESGTGSRDLQMRMNNHAGYFQSSFAASTTGTVTLYGKVSEAHDWYQLAQATGDTIVEVAILPFMRLEWAVVTSTFSAHVMEAI